VIFREFGIPLPGVTRWVIGTSNFVARYGAASAMVMIFELGLLIFLPFSFLGWGNYTVPFFDRVLGPRHTALVLRSLALFVEGRKPILLGLSTLANHYPTGWVRRRLRRVESDVKAGADWIESLWRHRVIKSAEAEVLPSAIAVGNLAWALLELADATERRLSTRFQLLIQTVFPLVVIMFGMVVFILAVAYFAPLVQIISGLTEQ
jgi:type II secretory pathway component PulF